jgi:hypothetical protein
MNGHFQFTLRQLLPLTLLLAVCLGVGKWCYFKYSDRVRSVTTDYDLQTHMQSHTGRRVSLRGRYQHIGDNSTFQVLWFGKHDWPIALVGLRANGSPPPSIPDGALIAVTGRLIDEPKDTILEVPLESSSRYESVSTTGVCCINVEEVSVLPSKENALPPPLHFL